jgi:glycosyltransferase involved in cell wall biosynthesis
MAVYVETNNIQAILFTNFRGHLMKILLVSFIDFDHPYGSHLRPYFLGHYLAAKGHNVVALCIKGKANSTANFTFVERDWLKYTTSSAKRYSLGFYDMYKMIRRYNPDIIYAHGYSLGFIATTLMKFSRIKLLKKIPVIVDLHGSTVLEQLCHSPGSKKTRLFAIMEKLALMNATFVTPACEAVKKFISEFYHIPIKKITAIPNGVLVERFHQLSLKDRTNLIAEAGFRGKKVVVMTAPRESTKSSDWSVPAIKVMYAAMSKIYETRKDVILQIIGGGPIVENPPPNVFYTQYVEDLNSALNIADLAVAPYPEWSVCGGARNKILEYFACRVPIISTASGMFGIPEAKPMHNYFFTNFNPEDLSAQILNVLSMEKADVNAISENACALIQEKYTWEKSAGNLNILFQKVLMNDGAQSKKTLDID